MTEEIRTTWDDGAADLLTVPTLSGTTVTLMRGPLVITGWSITNNGAGSVKVTFMDGGGQIGPAVQINANSTNNTAMPDRGVRVETDLEVTVGAGGTISGCVFIRSPGREWKGKEESQSTPSPSK